MRDPHARSVRAPVRARPGHRLGLDDWRSRVLADGVSVSSRSAFVRSSSAARATTRSFPGDVIRNRRFAAACAAILLTSAAFIASLLYLPQFLQKILDYSPVEAGVGMLPIMLGFAAFSFVAGPIYDRIGAKIVVTTGAFLIAVGALLLAVPAGGLGLRRAHARDGRAWGSASGSSTARPRRPGSPRSTIRARASPAGSHTWPRSPAARSGSG